MSPDPNWTEPVANATTFGDARANLEHALQVYASNADDVMVLPATYNVYGPGIATGLTMGDLRLIAKEIGAVTA